jgi:tetratricopeptide (TPR) repeat protein
MGFIYLQDRRSLPYYRKAVELSPQRPEYHRWLATSLNQLNRFDESIVEYRRAIEIDPLWYINYEHLAGALAFVGRTKEAHEVAARFLQLSGDDRAKLLLLRGLANNENRLADGLRYSKALLDAAPDERNNRFNYASALSALGENRRAAQFMSHEPISAALLSSDWPAFSAEAERFGHNFWDRSTLWKSAELLVATGHSDQLVRLYDAVQPLIRAGTVDGQSVDIPATALALRNVGRRAEADRVLRTFAAANAKLPRTGIGDLQRNMNEAAVAALSGRNEEALRILDRESRKNAIGVLPFPAMSLVRLPFFQSLSHDPRLIAADERVRMAVNAERKKAGLPPLSRETWVSDPKTLLTKN